MKKTIVIIAALVLLTLPVLASGSEGDEAGHGFNWIAFLGRVVNALILFGGLFILLRKPLAAYFKNSGQSIRSDIETRQGEIRKAENQLQEIDGRLGRLEAEIVAMRNQAEENGRSEMARLEEAGRLESERIRQLAEAQMQQRLESAVRQLKDRIANLAIEHFRADVAGSLDEKAQHRIIDRNIAQSKELHEGK